MDQSEHIQIGIDGKRKLTPNATNTVTKSGLTGNFCNDPDEVERKFTNSAAKKPTGMENLNK